MSSPNPEMTESGERYVTRRPRRRRKKKPSIPWRERASKQLKFMTMCVSFSLGLGNVWRFPYLSYENGGGAFLVPYMLLLLLAGIPLLATDMIIGQYSGLGPINLFRHMCPIFQGLGYAMTLVSVLTAIFYNMVFAWTLLYLYTSIRYETPWKGCTNYWNDETCFTNQMAKYCRAQDMAYYNASCISMDDMCHIIGKLEGNTKLEKYNSTHCYTNRKKKSKYCRVPECFNYTLASEQYLTKKVLKMSKGPLTFGVLDPTLIFWLFISWVICFIKMISRFHVKRYMMYITVYFPYVMFVVMFFRTIILEGALSGLKYYVVPKFRNILEPDMWGEAAAQICFSLGPGFGVVISSASYWNFNSDVSRNACIIGFMDTGSSVLGGIIIFGFIGFLSTVTTIPINKIVSEGTWLAFAALPEAVEEFYYARFWSVILYVFMVVSLGVDMQFDALESVMTSLIDAYPAVTKSKSLIICGLCLTLCFFGVIFTGPNGAFLFRMFDEYMTGWILVCLAFIENIVIFRIYNKSLGRDRQRFYEDYREMFGSEPTPYWCSCWKIFSPITLVLVLGFAWFLDEPPPFGPYVWEPMPIMIGKCLAASPLIVVIFFAVYRIIMKFKHGETWKSLITPTDKWMSARERGPKEDIFPDLM